MGDISDVPMASLDEETVDEIAAQWRAGAKARVIGERHGITTADVLELMRVRGLRPGYRPRHPRLDRDP